jgi:hypothetical protein
VWDSIGASDIFTALKNDTPIPDKPSAPQVDVAPSSITVQLLGSADTATTAYDDFTAAGYSASQPVPGTHTATTIEYDPGYDVSLQTLKAALPGVRTVAVPGLGATFRVTIGSDYAGLRQVAVKDASAPAKPRTASDDICS